MKTLLGLTLAIGLSAALGGCNESLAPLQASAPTGAVSSREILAVAPRPGVSPAGAPVAFLSLSGAPDAVSANFANALARALAQNGVTTQDAGGAAYLVQAHLSGQPAEGGGISIAFAFDVYGADRQRRHRLFDEVIVKSAAGDPWSVANEQVLAGLAARGARELAAWLTHTPEAIAAAPANPATASAPQASASAPLAFSPLR